MHLDSGSIAKFQRELEAMGYKFQFVTLAGFHALADVHQPLVQVALGAGEDRRLDARPQRAGQDELRAAGSRANGDDPDLRRLLLHGAQRGGKCALALEPRQQAGNDGERDDQRQHAEEHQHGSAAGLRLPLLGLYWAKQCFSPAHWFEIQFFNIQMAVIVFVEFVAVLLATNSAN